MDVWNCFYFFFFQAEDGIRDLTVTGVQTCALPIFAVPAWRRNAEERLRPVDVHAVEVRVVYVSDELASVVQHGSRNAVQELQVAFVDGTADLGEAYVRSVGGQRSTGNAVRFAALVVEDASR